MVSVSICCFYAAINGDAAREMIFQGVFLVLWLQFAWKSRVVVSREFCFMSPSSPYLYDLFFSVKRKGMLLCTCSDFLLKCNELTNEYEMHIIAHLPKMEKMLQ